MNFSQLPEFAQIKACELLSDQYSRCANETARLNLASQVQQAFVNLFTEGASITAPVNTTVEETKSLTTFRQAYSNNGKLLCDVIYENLSGAPVDIDELHQNLTNGLCSLPHPATPLKIKTILILDEQTKVIRGRLSDEALINWLRMLADEIEQLPAMQESIKRRSCFIDKTKENISSKKEFLNEVII